jgi:hypothetical protein
MPTWELLQIPPVLSGAWTSANRNLWTAKASCKQEVVCVSFQICEGIAHWAKSTRLAADTEAVRIGLGMTPSDPASVTIGCGPIAKPVRLAEPGARPVLPDKINIQTGIITPLCRFDSRPAIEVHVLFLASSDLRWGRNRLWRLHPSRLAAVSESCRTVLAGGRVGICVWPLLENAAPVDPARRTPILEKDKTVDGDSN